MHLDAFGTRYLESILQQGGQLVIMSLNGESVFASYRFTASNLKYEKYKVVLS